MRGDDYYHENLVLSDLRLGRESGLDILREVKGTSPATEVVMLTAFATTENAIQAMKLGAYDYVQKPFKVDELKLVVAKALERRALVAENRVLRRHAGPMSELDLLGSTPAIQEVREVVEKIRCAHSTFRRRGPQAPPFLLGFWKVPSGH